jgi:hypothetical protein
MGKTRAEDPAPHRQVYVETLISASLDRLWKLSQDPDTHPRWDLRFSAIIPEGTGAGEPVQFRYEFRLPFHTISGTGISLGHRTREGGQATSVLKFSTADPLSPIGPGAGYWRYIPTDRGIRFITGYDYRPGLGIAGRLLDRRLIRPALGWATAVSFDRLRLWAETGLDPATARTAWLLDAAARAAGLAAAAALLKRSRTHPGRWAAGLPALAVAAAALTFPAHRSVPRARRCLRRPPDRRAASAPSSLATLPAPQ